jgi:rhodanese-related sulfurtransferase
MQPSTIDWSRAAPGAYKVLKPGGTLFFSYRGSTADAIIAAEQLRLAGFKNVVLDNGFTGTNDRGRID